MARPETRHLVSFLAVADELNFTRAAGRLHVVPQALSTTIAQLESILGVRLFDRSTRRVELTESGAAYLPYVRGIVESLDQAGLAAKAAARRATGKMEVGLSATGALPLTPKLLRTYIDTHPGIELTVRHYDFTDPSGGLWSKQSDVALVRPPFHDEGLHLTLLAEEHRHVVLPDDHPLAGRSAVSFRELADEPWMYLLTDPAWCDFWSVADQRSAPAPRGAICLSQDDLFEAARAHRAIGLVPASVAEAQTWPGLAFALVADISPSAVAAACPDDAPRPEALDFIRLARQLGAQTSG